MGQQFLADIPTYAFLFEPLSWCSRPHIKIFSYFSKIAIPPSCHTHFQIPAFLPAILASQKAHVYTVHSLTFGIVEVLLMIHVLLWPLPRVIQHRNILILLKTYAHGRQWPMSLDLGASLTGFMPQLCNLPLGG
jgi:hypothetical protein